MSKQVSDVLAAIHNVEGRLKEAKTSIEKVSLIEDLLSLYKCLEIEVVHSDSKVG